MLRHLSAYTAPTSQRDYAFAGKDAVNDAEHIVLVTFFGGVISSVTVFCFADFDAYIDIVAAF
jgi:hypothetical protein